MYRTKVAVIRNLSIVVLVVLTCYYALSSPSAFPALKVFLSNPTSRRACPDPSKPDYFQTLTKSNNVNASKQKRHFRLVLRGQLIRFTCGLDISEFSFFISDVAGRLTDTKASRRGIMSLRNFQPGETIMSTSFDSMFSMSQIHRSKISSLVPAFRELGMNDMAILIVTLM